MANTGRTTKHWFLLLSWATPWRSTWLQIQAWGSWNLGRIANRIIVTNRDFAVHCVED